MTMRWLVVALVAGGLALTGCGLLGAQGAVPLAKADHWRDNLEVADVNFALAEVAYDRAAGERAWRDNVSGGLPAREGDPTEPGRYGDLDDVDFDSQVLVVWSSGESGTCPAWLADLLAPPEGGVEVVVEVEEEGACTDDYNPYRMVVALDRERVPEPGDLPVYDPDGVPAGMVRVYPDAD